MSLGSGINVFGFSYQYVEFRHLWRVQASMSVGQCINASGFRQKCAWQCLRSTSAFGRVQTSIGQGLGTNEFRLGNSV